MIRKAMQSDSEEIMKLWLQGNRQAHAFIAYDYFLSHEEEVRHAIWKSTVYVYEEAGAISGFAGIKDQYVEGLFVSSDAQGKGIGMALMDVLKETTDTLTLHVYEKNRPAVQFYLQQGFRIDMLRKVEELQVIEYSMHWTR